MKEDWELFERASLLEERESEGFLACRACLEGNLYLPEILLLIWRFEEYLWFVFKVLLKNSYGAFWLDPTKLSEIWWFDALKSTFDLSSKCCWRTLIGRLCLIQQSFILCRLQASMKEAWELFERASLLEERESESFLACKACLEGNLYLPGSPFL